MIFGPYMDNVNKISLLQRWILVHSFIYYHCDTNVVSDYMFDMNSKQLAKTTEEHPDDHEESAYYYAMRDFDGSTGVGFTELLNKEDLIKIKRDAYWIIDMFREKA